MEETTTDRPRVVVVTGASGGIGSAVVPELLAAVWREVDQGVPPPRPDVRRLPAWVMIGFSGFLVLVAAAVLIGLWTR